MKKNTSLSPHVGDAASSRIPQYQTAKEALEYRAQNGNVIIRTIEEKFADKDNDVFIEKVHKVGTHYYATAGYDKEFHINSIISIKCTSTQQYLFKKE